MTALDENINVFKDKIMTRTSKISEEIKELIIEAYSEGYRNALDDLRKGAIEDKRPVKYGA